MKVKNSPRANLDLSVVVAGTSRYRHHQQGVTTCCHSFDSRFSVFFLAEWHTALRSHYALRHSRASLQIAPPPDQAQLQALLAMTHGNAGDVFRRMDADCQENYLWACAMIAGEMRELTEAIHARRAERREERAGRSSNDD
ncbi:MAG: hypothetical protein EKK49_05970 [Rhodocyclaceae bacterium]|nr:MAG: hypothetical protein EKK49_05970 [Rhodocyclaceae bacterium]